VKIDDCGFSERPKLHFDWYVWWKGTSSQGERLLFPALHCIRGWLADSWLFFATHSEFEAFFFAWHLHHFLIARSLGLVRRTYPGACFLSAFAFPSKKRYEKCVDAVYEQVGTRHVHWGWVSMNLQACWRFVNMAWRFYCT
jgi:hypothetical protein